MGGWLTGRGLGRDWKLVSTKEAARHTAIGLLDLRCVAMTAPNAGVSSRARTLRDWFRGIQFFRARS